MADDVKDFAPLDDVLKRVQTAVAKYHASDDKLPALNSADFTFKAATKKDKSWSFTILFFTFGHTHTQETTHELAFHYAVPPKKPAVELLGVKKEDAVPFEDTLANVMTALGSALDATRALKIEGAGFVNASMTVQFVITKATTLGGTGTYDMVTITAGGGVSHSNTHSVKLVFGEKSIADTLV
ncbi:MAG: hypothetical protein ABSB88_10275 [Bryobacteraceae bacterium]